MSSTLIFTENCYGCKRGTTWHFKHPIKALFSRRYYDTDGSCGVGVVTLDSREDAAWFEGIRDAIDKTILYKDDFSDLEEIIDSLNSGNIIKAWHEY